MPRPLLSLVLPVYDEEEVLPLLRQKLMEFLAKVTLDVEIVFVNDGSRDRSLDLLREMASSDPRFKVLSFSRNFGQESAILAGLDYAHGSAVVVMDADLSDPPDTILEMIEQWRAGFDVVNGQRIRRVGEGWGKAFGRWWERRAYRAFVRIDVPQDAGAFRLMGRNVILALRSLRESHRFVRGLVPWLGFRQTSVLYERQPRAAGDRKRRLSTRFGMAVDGIASTSTSPLRVATLLGFMIGIVALVAGIWAVVAYLFVDSSVSGSTATIIVMSLLASAQFFMIGILGEYVGRTHEQAKRRPLYVVDQWVNLGRAPDSDEPEEDARAKLPKIISVKTPPPAFAPEPVSPARPAAGATPKLRPIPTLMGVAPQPPAAFPPVPQNTTVVMDVAPTKEALELLSLEPETDPAAPEPKKGVPGVLVGPTPDAPPPPQLVTAAMPVAARPPPTTVKPPPPPTASKLPPPPPRRAPADPRQPRPGKSSEKKD